MAGELILIVDDSPEIVKILKDLILTRLGYKVIVASDGQTGLEMAVQQNPDLILLDMDLPRLSGLEMLAELRQTTCVSPVIFMTVFGSERIAVEAFRLGVRDYLNKPFTVDEVRLSVDRALSEKRLMREREELNKNLLTAEAVRVTVITLSHYLNNSTMVLNNVLTLLEEKLDDKYPDPNFLKLVQDGQDSVKYIQAVMQVLQQATSVKLTPYTRTTPMIDIEAALKENLSQLSKKKK